MIKNVHYFDGTEGLGGDKEMQELLNQKLTTVSSEFTSKLKHLNEVNKKQFRTILKFKEINKDKYDEMTPKVMVQKLLIVADQP